LIDHNNVCCRESLVRDIFLPYDADCILSIPLCGSWPEDKLIWHYDTQGIFSVKSTYHMPIDDSHANQAGSLSSAKGKVLWKCVVPPQIKLFVWRACASILPTATNIARSIPGSSMACLFAAMQKSRMSMLALNVVWLFKLGMHVGLTRTYGC